MNIPYRNGGMVTEHKVKAGQKDRSIDDVKMAYSMAETLTRKYDGSNVFLKKLSKLLNCDVTKYREIEIRLYNLLGFIESYGYSYEEAMEIIENNFELLSIDTVDLKKRLAILSQYDLDEKLLVDNSTPNIDASSLFALSEYIKSIGSKVTNRNIITLLHCIKKNGIKYLEKLYPLTVRKVGVLYYGYEKIKKERKENSKLSLTK